jgi:hypothetical protein
MQKLKLVAVFAVLVVLGSLGGRASALNTNGTLKEKLAQFITAPPDIVQFTKDRKFEEAWIIKSSTARPSPEACKKYLDKETFKVLILEYVWNSQDDDKRFVLTLFQDERVKMRDAEEFLKTALDLFYNKSDFLSLMNRLDAEVIGKPYLLQGPVDAVSIGIFNYWFSTGPIDPLWRAGENFSEDAIREKITARPEIQKTRLNFQGLFFKFNIDGRYNGPYYGFKTPCCKKDGNFWIVDFPTTFRWMRFMLSKSQPGAERHHRVHPAVQPALRQREEHPRHLPVLLEARISVKPGADLTNRWSQPLAVVMTTF